MEITKPFLWFVAMLCLLAAFYTPSERAATAPELPRATVNVTIPIQAGRIIRVAAGANLQAAYDSAQPGDTLELEAGATFARLNMTGNGKSGPGFILIRSTRASELPEGRRVSPQDAAKMAKIITTDNSPALEAGPTYGPANQTKASHIFLIGIEVTLGPGVTQNGGLVKLGATSWQTTAEAAPDNLIFDRCYIHGSATATLTRGVTLNSAATAFVNCYVSDCHGFGFDTQAICGWNGPGPFRIENNYLEAAGENFMLGGADPKIAGLIPSDVTFERNTLAKPASWNPNDPSYAGKRWSVKNLYELKNARRVLIRGNTLDGCWVDAQTGIAIQFTPRNQEGTAAWSTVEDVTFESNIVRHSASGINILGTDDIYPSGRASRIKISNNLFDQIGGPLYGGGGRFLQLIAGPVDVTVEHNTARHTAHTMIFDVAPTSGLVYQNNINCGGDYGVFGSGASEGTPSLTQYAPGALFASNGLVGRNFRLYPAGNHFPATEAEVGFTDPAAGDFRLTGSSPLAGKATDGKDIGVDTVALTLALNGGPATPPPSPVDTTPPGVASNVSGLGEYGATITVATDETATVYVEFGRGGALTAQTKPSAPGLSHQFVLDFLSPGMTVSFRVCAQDQAGNRTDGPIQTFRTLPVTQSQTVTITVSRE